MQNNYVKRKFNFFVTFSKIFNVIVKASFGNRKAHYKYDNDEKEGLKRIQNSSLKIGAEEKNNVVQIINEQWNKVTNLEIKVPANFSL